MVTLTNGFFELGQRFSEAQLRCAVVPINYYAKTKLASLKFFVPCRETEARDARAHTFRKFGREASYYRYGGKVVTRIYIFFSYVKPLSFNSTAFMYLMTVSGNSFPSARASCQADAHAMLKKTGIFRNFCLTSTVEQAHTKHKLLLSDQPVRKYGSDK